MRPQWLETAQAVRAQYFGELATSEEVLAWLEKKRRPRSDELHHLLLEVGDLERSVGFYVEVLGFEVRKREPFRDGRELVLTEQGLGLTNGATGSRARLPAPVLRCAVGWTTSLSGRVRLATGSCVARGPGPTDAPSTSRTPTATKWKAVELAP